MQGSPKLFWSRALVATSIMSLSFERLKSMAIPTKNLINGYIRESQTELFGDLAIQNPYYNIPPLINNHCMLFYEVFAWYRKRHGQGLKFLSDTEVMMDEFAIEKWSICMFENEISDKVCDRFSITFKIKAIKSNFVGFDIGYATGDSLTESVKNWNEEIGCNANKGTSWGWCLCGRELYYISEFGVKSMKDQIPFALNDLCKLLFDFRKKKVRIYHNDQEVNCQYLKADKLWIGLCLIKKGTTIEMMEYKYYTDQ